MSSTATIGVKTRSSKRKRERRDAYADGAIPGLPNHLVVAHKLRSEYFDDPADLARLPSMSRAMRDTVVATGLELEELDEKEAVDFGCLSAVQRLERRGHLSRQEYLCQAAARGGHLEELKALRAVGCRANCCPWDHRATIMAAKGGHLELLQWEHANGCQWIAETRRRVAAMGYLDPDDEVSTI